MGEIKVGDWVRVSDEAYNAGIVFRVERIETDRVVGGIGERTKVGLAPASVRRALDEADALVMDRLVYGYNVRDDRGRRVDPRDTVWRDGRPEAPLPTIIRGAKR